MTNTEQRSDARVTVRKTRAKRAKTIFGVSPVQGGCVYCAYEVKGHGSVVPPIPRATLLFSTEKGLRALCAEHVRLGKWRS
jgi:hypothetical protein